MIISLFFMNENLNIKILKNNTIIVPNTIKFYLKKGNEIAKNFTIIEFQ